MAVEFSASTLLEITASRITTSFGFIAMNPGKCVCTNDCTSQKKI